jgi:hypothetical protein
VAAERRADGLDCVLAIRYDGGVRSTTEMPASQVFEGTWEEVARQADRLADKRVRLVIVENGQDEAAEAQLPFYATATPEERAQTWVE